MSRSAALLSRRSLLARVAAVALGAGLVTACGPDNLGDTGALISGRTRLPPLKAAPPPGHITVQMLPFTGIPVTVGDAVFQRFRNEAKEEGVELVHRLEDPATYRIVGHFVALGYETSATIVFDYEIFDASGRMVHRIVGQEVAKLSDGDPWSGVDTDAEKRIAVRTVRAIKAWLTRAAP